MVNNALVNLRIFIYKEKGHLDVIILIYISHAYSKAKGTILPSSSCELLP